MKGFEKTKTKVLRASSFVSSVNLGGFSNFGNQWTAPLSFDEIYYVDDNDYLNAIKLMQDYKYTINYSDCLILLSMVKNEINTIVSFDSDFNRVDGIKRIYI